VAFCFIFFFKLSCQLFFDDSYHVLLQTQCRRDVLAEISTSLFIFFFVPLFVTLTVNLHLYRVVCRRDGVHVPFYLIQFSLFDQPSCENSEQTTNQNPAKSIDAQSLVLA
jgi:hypothetical protein